MVGLIGLTGVAIAGPAQAPVAVIEDMQGKVTGAELMDYVVPGQVIKLDAGSSIMIGYMKSCWRETISGIGTVIVGTEQSSVHLAEFKAGKVPCDTSLSRAHRQGGRRERGNGRAQPEGRARQPPLVLHGQSPMVAATERGKLVVDRLDVKGEHYEVDLAKARPSRGKFYDLAKTQYRAETRRRLFDEAEFEIRRLRGRCRCRARRGPGDRPPGDAAMSRRMMWGDGA